MSVCSNNDKYFNIDDPGSKFRIEFYQKLPKNATVLEVGVWYGKNARIIYHVTQPKHLYLVDTWTTITKPGDVKVRTVVEWEQMYNLVCTYFQDKNASILRKVSKEVAQDFEDEFFDWIYIDAGHSYDSCYTDLVAWYPKIKSGGYLCGHDYCETLANVQKSFGVKKAVDRFMKERKLRIEFLSRHAKAVDYAIRKV